VPRGCRSGADLNQFAREADVQDLCAWCGLQLSEPMVRDAAVTHGICASCARKLMNNLTEPLPEFLDRLDAPVAVVDGDGVVLTANRQARRLIGKDHAELVNQRAGDVMECGNSFELEGCGHTVHCNGCAIRYSVETTYYSGTACTNVPAFLDRRTPEGTARTWYSISTEKVADRVLLRIEPRGEVA